MYILKFAAKNISRSKGRSILISIIVLIIAFALCVGLCIRQAAADAKEAALEDVNITATISPDRENALDQAMGGGKGGGDFDASQLSESMADSLTLDELKVYAEADSVKSFYYIMSASMDASGDLEAYDTSASSDDSSTESSDNNSSAESNSNDSRSFGGAEADSGDFTIEGYSSDEAMTQFTDGSCSITDGEVFEEGTDEMVCIISNELAEYNSLEVGDTIELASTDDSDETYELEIVGIYENSQASAEAGMMGMGGGFTDPANYIYTSYNTLESITSDSDTVTGTVSGTYVLGDLDAYEAFTEEVTELGLTDDYTVSSSDITAYEQSASGLDNLAKIAGYFLIVILLIGAAILIVLNVFATRERKYEIGVLTAIGMKKKKVVQVFMSEILLIALVAVIVGGGIGAATSVPITNALLSSQAASQQANRDSINEAFGRDFNNAPGDAGSAPDSTDTADSADSDTSDSSTSDSTDATDSADSDSSNSNTADTDTSSEDTGSEAIDSGGDRQGGPGAMFGSYITEVSSAVNIKVLLELLAMCIGLAAVSGIVSVVFITRYDPLRILSNRD